MSGIAKKSRSHSFSTAYSRHTWSPILEVLEDRRPLTGTSATPAALVDAVELQYNDFIEAGATPSAIVSTAISAGAEADKSELYYVSPFGSDDNSGRHRADPFKTINGALRHVRPGDKVLVMPGIYREEFYNPPGGTDWDHPVKIKAFDSTDRPMLRPDVGAARVFSFASSDSSFIEINGFVIDARNVEYDAIKITWGSSTGASHHVRIKNSTIKNAPHQGVLLTGASHGVSHNELINLNVHHNGTTEHDHGVYVSTPYTLVKNSRIHDNAGWGIHSYGGDASGSIYRNNEIFNNATAGARGAGVGVYNGAGIRVIGNRIYGNDKGVVLGDHVADARVRGNVIRENRAALLIAGPSVVHSVVKDNVLFRNEDNTIQDFGTDTVLVNNVSIRNDDETAIAGLGSLTDFRNVLMS